jgi:hypothetical protein
MMTSLRSPDLQLFLTSAEAAIRHGSAADGPVRVAAERIFTALRVPSPEAECPDTPRLPVCRYLPAALEHARRQPGPVGTLADAFAVIEPQLSWKARPGAEAQGEQFLSGHANATITGPEGLEIRRDVRIGVSLMRRTRDILTTIIRPRRSMSCCRAGNGARRAIHGTSLASVALSIIRRTLSTQCARRNSRCSRFGSFGQNRTMPEPEAIGCDDAHHTAARPPSTNRSTALM